MTANNKTKKLLFFWGVLLFTSFGVGQQKIDSKGDDNTNVNAQNSIVIIPQITLTNERELRTAIRKSGGGDNGWEGTLVAGKKKIDVGYCDSPNSPLTAILGSNIFTCTNHPCSLVSTRSDILLAFSGEKGHLLVDAKVLEPDGSIIVAIEKGKFYVNQNHTFRTPARPDPSTLQVFDQKGNVVLNLKFANSKTVLVNGEFDDGFGHHISIGTNAMTTYPSHTTYVKECIEGAESPFGRKDGFQSWRITTVTTKGIQIGSVPIDT